MCLRCAAEKPRKMAKQRLAKAKKLLQEKKQDEFYSEVSRALWGYVSDRFGIPLSELNRENVTSALRSRSVSPETITSIASTMDQCEFARFAPAADSLQMEHVFESASSSSPQSRTSCDEHLLSASPFFCFLFWSDPLALESHSRENRMFALNRPTRHTAPATTRKRQSSMKKSCRKDMKARLSTTIWAIATTK